MEEVRRTNDVKNRQPSSIDCNDSNSDYGAEGENNSNTAVAEDLQMSRYGRPKFEILNSIRRNDTR